jgi:26S proteasome regulatory subunit N5
MRVLLQKEDYIRTLIVSNKINRKHLNDDNLMKLKLEFYQLMIMYYLHERIFIDVAKCYKVIYDFIREIELKLTNSTVMDPKYVDLSKLVLSSVNKQTIFNNYVMFLNVCPPELETRNMFNELNIFYRKDLEEVPDMDMIVKRRLADELIFINSQFLGIFANYPIFQLDAENPNAKEHFVMFRKQLIQHNLNIFQKFFSNVRLGRIGEMIGIEGSEVELELADMVINKYLYAKINRMTGTVVFKPKQDGNGKLNDIGIDLSKMLKTMETTCHLIHKENLKYDIK